jgi:hypothetical protein
MRLAAMLIDADIVHIESVDPRQAEALQAVLEGAHDPVIGIVVDRLERHHLPPLAGIGHRAARSQQAPDFGRQYPLVARHGAQRIADAALGLAEPVIGRGVDIAHPGRPGSAYDRLRGFASHLDTAAAERRAAEPQNGHLQRGAPDPALGKFRHRPPSRSSAMLPRRRS